MLDAIADFWKPVRKNAAQIKLNPDELRVGSALGFGFMPQATLSGRRLSITAINTYQFGADILTSFVLSQDKDAGASLIVDDAGDGPYLAISRRISISDRSKLFEQEQIDAVIGKNDASKLECKETLPDYKGWLVGAYKREAHNINVLLFKGDYRAKALPAHREAQSFSYTLLVSSAREHALEIERYDDGRVEVYATVYRRISDISDVSHEAVKEFARTEVKLESGSKITLASNTTPAISLTSATMPEASNDPVVAPKPELVSVKEPPVVVAAVIAPEVVVAEAKSAPMSLPEFAAEAVVKKETQEAAEAPASKPAIIIQPTHTQPYVKQEITAMNKEMSNFVNESIDCELHVANKIIDEAIRNEMRINDVVRRVIGLPVSQQESVQIPVTLTDQDYSLLAIRYAIAATDREAIKKRIIEDLGDFSGGAKKKAA